MAKKAHTPFDMVRINIPLVKNEPECEFVYVNEKTFEIKRGEDVLVPRYVYDAIIDSQEQNKRSVNFINDTKSK